MSDFPKYNIMNHAYLLLYNLIDKYIASYMQDLILILILI